MKIKFNKVYDGGKHVATIRYGRLILSSKFREQNRSKLNIIAKQLGLKIVEHERKVLFCF